MARAMEHGYYRYSKKLIILSRGYSETVRLVLVDRRFEKTSKHARWSSWYPRNLLAGRSWVQVPAIATFSHIVSFFLLLSFLPVKSAKKRVNTAGKRWLILVPQ